MRRRKRGTDREKKKERRKRREGGDEVSSREELATVEVMDARLTQDQVKVFLVVTVVFIG